MSDINPTNAPNQPVGPAPMPGDRRPAAPYSPQTGYAQPYQYPYAPGYAQPYPQPYGPYFGYYQAYPYPWAPVAPPTPTPAERASKPGVARVRNIILAVVLSVLTLGAIGLGAGAALSSQSAPSPTAGGFQQVYDSALNSGETANWDENGGCALEAGGLHATSSSTSSSACAFQPSTKNDLLSQGFYLATTLAPAGQVTSQEAAAIDLVMPDNSAVELRFVQDGTYALVEMDASGTPLVERSGVTIAWHADGFEENTVVVRYAADTQTLTAYVNGQSVLSESLQVQLASGAALSLGTPARAEALYTHFALYSPTPASN